MAAVKNVLLMRFVPERGQAGLAVLRVCTGATLFLKHGLEKQPAHWAQFMAHFPIRFGIGAHASFFIAFFSDFVCSRLFADHRIGDALGRPLLSGEYLRGLGIRSSFRVLGQGSGERSR